MDELVVRFTHTVPVDWMLPGVPTTGKRVEVAAVVIIKFEGGKIAHEHIYWDQASVLVQFGLLDPVGLPVLVQTIYSLNGLPPPTQMVS